MSICAAFMFFTTLLALCLRFLLVWENHRLDKKYGPKVEAEEVKGDTPVAEDNYGASFRYAL
jgi:hypothetical protein